MRLGLVTDIHNHVAPLTRALEIFREEGVEQVLNLGDACDPFSATHGAEVARLLREAKAVGVWGNHDVGLCHEVEAFTREKYTAETLEYMTTMQPRLRVDGCHFSHREASVDPRDIAQLWDFSEDGRNLLLKSRLGLQATEDRLQFLGHYHCWWAATPDGPLAWEGERPLEFAPDERYFVVVAPVFDGWCAVLDTGRGVLRPYRCGGAGAEFRC
jgi:hypothetical protein